MSPPAAATAAARTPAPRASRPRRLKAAPAPARRPQRPARPRRVSGPARRSASVARPSRARTAPAPTSTLRGAAARAGTAALRVPDHRLLDRLVRGRYWIGLVGCALIGMVAIQVAMLRINSDIGSDVARATSLERANAVLSAENSRLATLTRIQAEGARLGLVMPSAQGVRYLFTRPGEDAANAVATMRAPAPAAPVSQPVTQPVQTQTAAAQPGTTATAPATTQTAATPATGAAAQSQIPQTQGTTTSGP